MKYYIYKIINNVNNKIYVGKHIDKSDIGYDNYMGSGIVLKAAQQKYGIKNFTKEILEECTESTIDQREIYWISKLDALNPKIGYNIATGGEGGNTIANNPNAELIKKKLSEGLRGTKNPNFGTHRSDERKEYIRNCNKGLVYWNNGIYNKRSKTCPGEGWIRGILVTEESKQLRSKTHKGKISTFKGKHHSIESKKKLSKSHKGLYDGANNPSAKTFEIISPQGIKYIVKGTLEQFCKEHQLSIAMSQKYRNLGPCPLSKYNTSQIAYNTAGWIFNEI